ncbi:ABC transporter permease [Streptacidiphilus sp. EB129]|uniref:ABC transporter permease n=1 Tax=Streptacidiphilus sp. EB129 TaxID=3156262 RepID=UPI003513C65E
MSTLTYAVRDSATMLRRDFRHTLRYPVMTVATILTPIFMLLLFVYVLGGQLSGGSRGHYLDYVIPGIIVMTVGSGCAATSVSISADMNEGVIPRFRSMAIFRPSVLIGQAVGSVIRTMLSLVLVVGTALALGFRSSATPVEWLAATGLTLLLVIALTWVATALGLQAKTPAAANSSTLPLQFVLPFLSSAFIDPSTMPVGLRWVAQNQPFTKVIDTLRGLLTGTPIGHSGAWALGWCVLLTVVGFVGARAVFNRDGS